MPSCARVHELLWSPFWVFVAMSPAALCLATVRLRNGRCVSACVHGAYTACVCLVNHLTAGINCTVRLQIWWCCVRIMWCVCVGMSWAMCILVNRRLSSFCVFSGLAISLVSVAAFSHAVSLKGWWADHVLQTSSICLSVPACNHLTTVFQCQASPGMHVSHAAV